MRDIEKLIKMHFRKLQYMHAQINMFFTPRYVVEITRCIRQYDQLNSRKHGSSSPSSVPIFTHTRDSLLLQVDRSEVRAGVGEIRCKSPSIKQTEKWE